MPDATSEHMRAIGRLGGESTKAKYGTDGEYYAFIGEAGGRETLRRYGVAHFRRASRRGVEARRAQAEAAV